MVCGDQALDIVDQGAKRFPANWKVVGLERLRKRGILNKSTKAVNPLDQLSPQQRKRQLAAEALELRRQNAIQMVEANKLLPKQQTA